MMDQIHTQHTDAELANVKGHYGEERGDSVSADFAAQLEQELADAQKHVTKLDRDLALWRNAWSAQKDTIREFERQFAYQVQRARKLAELVDFDVLETFRKTMPDDMPEDWKP